MSYNNLLNLKHFKGFCTTIGDDSVEARRITAFCIIHDISHLRVKNTEPCPKNYVPSGSVEWCTLSLGYNIIPDYYPDWLQPYLYRKVWKSNKWLMKKAFVKPADMHKRFSGKITSGSYKGKKKPPFWYSEIISFVNEWRYYISNGKVLCGEWYAGDEVNTPPAPEFTIPIPEGLCAAIDFGLTKDGKFALVEAQPPFACGWYGKDDKIYLQWVIDGWEYMLKQEKI
jgi:hypothetical protein